MPAKTISKTVSTVARSIGSPHLLALRCRRRTPQRPVLGIALARDDNASPAVQQHWAGNEVPMIRERDGERDQPADQRGGDDGGCGLAHGSACAAMIAEPLTGAWVGYPIDEGQHGRR